MNRRRLCRVLLGGLTIAASAISATSVRAVEQARIPLKADQVMLLKHARQLLLMRNGRVIRAYKVALGRNPVGHKEREGDGRTPEGVYLLDWRNPRSAFYRSIHISYPSDEDFDRAFSRNDDPGGLIMIHGLPNGRERIGRNHISRWGDWTDGCIAVTNREMDEIWTMVDDGTIIDIRP